MGKKRRGHPNIEEILDRPWCYYCERDFEDLKLLISHQKAKHFKCDRCGRRLNTAGGLSVHMNQVHKENLDQVENTLPNRGDPSVEIFGMEGIPDDIRDSHRNRLIQTFYQAQEERRVATGNPLPGQALQNTRKKLKFETAEELKARLAEWIEKKKNGGVVEVPAPTTNFPGYAAQTFGGGEGIPARPPTTDAPHTDDIDNLIRQAEARAASEADAAAVKKEEEEKEGKDKKKEKEKKAKMFYDDVETSPEEKMAALPKYTIAAA